MRGGGASSFKMRFLTFALNALWEEVCPIENGSSFHNLEKKNKWTHIHVFAHSI